MYLIIILLPLVGSIISGFFGRKVGVKGGQFITCSLIITTTSLAVLTFFEVGFNNIPAEINILRWIDSESLNVPWGFYFDSLTVCMLIPVLIVSSLVHIYSIDYMSNDPISKLGKSSSGDRLPNSGYILKLHVPSHSCKTMSGWGNYSCKVISSKISENEMEYRGPKSKNLCVKEQWVNGGWCGIHTTHLRCTLTGFERNFKIKNLSNRLKKQYSTNPLSPWFWSGLIDAAGLFSILVDKKITNKIGYMIQTKFTHKGFKSIIKITTIFRKYRFYSRISK